MKVRIGIDVGGTFTDAVVINNETGEIIAKEKIATTHYHESGVAGGIIEIITNILENNKIKTSDVVFIAHGTTQATNALLEGDVAKVGLIGIGNSVKAKAELNINNIELANNKFLHIFNEYIDIANYNINIVNEKIDLLVGQGAEVIVVSEAFSIEDPTKELEVLEICEKKKIYATAGHQISQLYGLKTRTRTAIINASLIPKMMETANMTEKVVKEIGITTELMIMRADGGVMSINEVRKRPILTMLSGLAAGVAGALMYEKLSNGIFFEVGGTSIDISLIKDGKVIIQNAQVGGHKTYLKSLDVRTLAVAGGSMIRIEHNKIIDVGPRSAHLADLEYENFTNQTNMINPVLKFISPLNGDPSDYAVVETEHGNIYALTLAGAANVLGYIPENDYAYADITSAKIAWEAAAKALGREPQEIAKEAMDIACKKIWHVVEQMIFEYKMDSEFITLVGGGGSASVTTQALAERHQMKYKIANNAPYISTIGVAMAMIREQIEKSIINPTTEDIKALRMEITNKIIESGALEDSIEIVIDVDKQNNIVTAIATGSSEFKAKDFHRKQLSESEIKDILVNSCSEIPNEVNLVASAGKWFGYDLVITKKKMFGMSKTKNIVSAIVDEEGVIFSRKNDACIYSSQKSKVLDDLKIIVNKHSHYGDAGCILPKINIFHKYRHHDYSGIQELEQLIMLVNMDVEFTDENEKMIILVEY